MAVELNNVPVAAAALYNLLTGLFTFIDEQVEPKKLGVITSGKMQWVAQQVGMQAEFAGMIHFSPIDHRKGRERKRTKGKAKKGIKRIFHSVVSMLIFDFPQEPIHWLRKCSRQLIAILSASTMWSRQS